MSRKTPYIRRPPSTWSEDIERLNQTRLYLVSRFGPLGFLLKTDNVSLPPIKIFIGEQMCSCGGGAARGRLCVHILFVMLKVLRLKPENPLSWQFSLTDSELQQVLSSEIGTCIDKKQENETRRAYLRKGQGRATSDKSSVLQSAKKAQRKDLCDDHICGICQEDMTIEEFENKSLCFCETQCGSNFHKKCLRMYADFNRSQKRHQQLSCPICRGHWIKIPEAPKRRKAIMKLKPVKCSGKCNTFMQGYLYRCASCHDRPAFNLCHPCFENGRFSHDHAYCCFVKSNLRGSLNWEPAVSKRELHAVSNELMRRELTDLDYDLLLSLDDDSKQNLVSHLMKGIKRINTDMTKNKLECILCSRNSNLIVSMKSLPCSHIAHESCLLELMSVASFHHILGAAGAKCPKCKEGWIFPTLIEERRNVSTNKENVKISTPLTKTTKYNELQICHGVEQNGLSQIDHNLNMLVLNGRTTGTASSSGKTDSQLCQTAPRQIQISEGRSDFSSRKIKLSSRKTRKTLPLTPTSSLLEVNGRSNFSSL